ncbi:hypothetical protein HEK616_10300 [Streptomyces nigrescens]|uniref:Uncharacterized protein n=1 Tax=Streptomyces nigrescens TaxID=1920 RepID=A0ABM7ZM87_STRNI|nr:hypothetical protein [Streptomyces nigrescens]BDM67543.1 hypothetical protein HEK616_10300 [Streptomyces nigrescens]
MTPAAHDQLAILREQREELQAERLRIEKAHCLAVLDHITAKIRAACPEAVYVTFAFYTSRTLDLHGVLGAQPSPLGSCPELWDNRDGEDEHPLDDIADQIESDVQAALAPHSSPAWASVHRNAASDGNSWLLELPPPDRAARVAELVREHHPEATAIVVDGRAAGRVIEIFEGVADDGTQMRTPRPGWPPACDTALAGFIAQILALPALADRHLMPLPGDYTHPFGLGTSDQVHLMPLPPTA